MLGGIQKYPIPTTYLHLTSVHIRSFSQCGMSLLIHTLPVALSDPGVSRCAPPPILRTFYSLLPFGVLPQALSLTQPPW